MSKRICIGTRWIKPDDEVYFLAQTESFKVALIGLDSGNRWEDPVLVGNPIRITKKEWNDIASGHIDEWKRVK